MLIRLLVAVLTVVGPTPFRVCTCAASVPARQPAELPAPPVAAVPAVKTCRCGHGAAAKHTPPVKRTARAHADCGESHPNPHDRDCPAVNPAPAARDTGTPPTPDAPTDCATAPAVWVESVPLAGATRHAPPERLCAPKLPLFITLLALRN